MTRRELIEKLDELREEIALCSDEDFTDYARERAYMTVVAAIEELKENEE